VKITSIEKKKDSDKRSFTVAKTKKKKRKSPISWLLSPYTYPNRTKLSATINKLNEQWKPKKEKKLNACRIQCTL
jgi:hypothetical protein